MRALITGIFAAAAFCAQAQDNRDVLYQVSTMDALLSGIYDSVATVDEVLRHGGFGLGTFDAVDGEMMVLDGVVYLGTFGGSINVMPPSTGTPFMAVTDFVPDRVLDAPELQSSLLRGITDAACRIAAADSATLAGQTVVIVDP